MSSGGASFVEVGGLARCLGVWEGGWEVGGLAWCLGVAGSAWEWLGVPGSGLEWPVWLCEEQRGGGTCAAWKTVFALAGKWGLDLGEKGGQSGVLEGV